MTFTPPDNALGAELVWWREDGNRHTLLTIAGPLFAPRIGASRVGLIFALYDVEGRFVTSWQRALGADESILVDSRGQVEEIPSGFTEGVLVVWVTPMGEVPPFADDYTRALSMVDWFSEGGELVSLHADQSLASPSDPIELTEIVFRETSQVRTALVIVNGPTEQPPGALQLVLRNGRGEERSFDYPHSMAPFSVNKVALAEHTTDLAGFCGGAEATITGRFAAHGVFTRPYVVTTGEIVSGYHGGNRYIAPAIPRVVHRSIAFADADYGAPRELMLVAGQKEMNPAYATHGPSLTTRVHLFQSHGALEEDFFVDASLYDTTGRLVAHRERWGVAPRRGVTTCEVEELCGALPFEGHIALRFSEDARKESFPWRLQALMEYRTPVSVARSMLWSDRWNAVDRVGARHPYRALFRVFSRGPRLSTLAITNPSVATDYDRSAPFVVRLRSGRGEERVFSGSLAPYATKVSSIDELFPERDGSEVAIAVVESPFDLASMHLTRDSRSGVVAAEHLMAIVERADGCLIVPCGA